MGRQAHNHGHAMDASLMFSASPLPKATPAAAPATASCSPASQVGGTDAAPSQTTPGKNFAGVMRDLLPTHERQKVAASKSSDPSSLKSEALGAQIEVITAHNAQPDADSLTAFARAQGLDESAVMALFGEKPSPDLPTAPSLDSTAALSAALLNSQTTALTTSPTAAPMAGLFPAMQAAEPDAPAPSALNPDVAWLADQLSADITVQVSALNPESPSLPTSTGPVDASTLTTASWLATLLGALVKTPASSEVNAMAPTPSVAHAEEPTGLPISPALCTPDVSMISSGAQAPSGSPSPLPFQALGLPTALATVVALPVAALPAAASAAVPLPAVLSSAAMAPDPLGLDASAPAATSHSSAALGSVEDLAPVTPVPQEAMRIRLVPAWENVTQQLHQLSGTAGALAWGALTASHLGGPIRTVALDLREAATQEDKALDAIDLSTPTDNPLSSAGPDQNRTSASASPMPSTAPALPGMPQTLRQAHYQQLADRLGQAMAERLQSQIARGEWKLQMRLNPASLGRIDVELDMHAKGLDAVFRSDNPLTRELMAQSMPKLKDSLTQSGMAVASVWVNSDAGRQSGGNPTPQRETAPDSDNVASAQTDTAPEAVTKEKRMPDGFDVLA